MDLLDLLDPIEPFWAWTDPLDPLDHLNKWTPWIPWTPWTPWTFQSLEVILDCNQNTFTNHFNLNTYHISFNFKKHISTHCAFSYLQICYP